MCVYDGSFLLYTVLLCVCKMRAAPPMRLVEFHPALNFVEAAMRCCCCGATTASLMLPCGHTACGWCLAVGAIRSQRVTVAVACDVCNAVTPRAALQIFS